MAVWDAGVVIDDALVRALLAEQFPELDAGSVRLLGEGWDNSVWAVEERWAFRFPRRQVAVPLVAREVEVLPRLAPLLPAPIPVPTFLGEPGEGYPWPFVGCPLLPGHEPADVDLSADDRIEIGAALRRFLRVLHAPETLAVGDPAGRLPVDPNRRADMPFRVERTRDRLAELSPALWESVGRIEAILSGAEHLPPSGAEALVHGDLHFRHVLVENGRLAGVIDWGDVCRADPAIDLVLYWCFLPAAARTAFVEEYGTIPEDSLLRGRVLAVFLCLILREYAHREGYPRIEAEARVALERTLGD